MKIEKYLLTKLAEEASEIAHIALKTSLFGTDSKDPREQDGETNLQKLEKELMDMTAVLLLMAEVIQPSGVSALDQDNYIKEKKSKLLDYFVIVNQLEKKEST